MYAGRIPSGWTRPRARSGGHNTMNNAYFGNHRWSRRGFLQSSAAAVAAAYGVYPLQGKAADIPEQYDGSKFLLAAPEPNPKHGGVLRIGILSRLPHFDFQQSGTVGSL